jgi:patched 1 protein
LPFAEGGRLEQEMNYLSRVQQEADAVAARTATTMKPGVLAPISPVVTAPEIPRENGLGGGFQVIIQTPDVVGKNVLNKHDLLKHVEIMNEIANFKVDMFGEYAVFLNFAIVNK